MHRKMRQIIVNLALFLALLAVAAAAIIPFAADAQLRAARRLEIGYRWKRADKAYSRAVMIDPFDAKYPAEYGNFLIRRSAYYRKEGNSLLERAQSLYARALHLDPRSPEYAMRLGEIEILKNKTEGRRSRVENIFKNFKTALLNDPYGFNTSYFIGYAGVRIWPVLNEEEKKMLLGRLKYSLKLEPWRDRFIYPHVLRYTQDKDILKHVAYWEVENYEAGYKPGRLRMIEDLKKEKKGISQEEALILQQDWHGMCAGKENTYRDGLMYWSGTIYSPVSLPQGPALINIRAKASPAYGVWPYMILELDGEKIAESFIESSEWRDYTFTVDTGGGIKILSITFPNDGGNLTDGEDRNLYIGEAGITKVSR